MDRPLTIANVQNVSLVWSYEEGSQPPIVVAKFIAVSAVCESDYRNDFLCAAVLFSNASNIVLKEMTIAVKTPSVSGIMLWNASRIDLQSLIIYSHFNRTCPFGISICFSNTVNLSSVSVYSFRQGIAIESTNSCFISRVS